MGRLTEYGIHNGDKGIWAKEEGGSKTFFAFYDEGYKAVKTLAHYEDLEEQGRLIEVVRCKDCWRYDTGAGYDGWGLCELYDQDRKDNDYCSFGELKELEGDKE